jgi:hypothetical protein
VFMYKTVNEIVRQWRGHERAGRSYPVSPR